MTAHADDHTHIIPAKYYVWTWIFLMVMLVLTVAASFVHITDTINVLIMLAIAVLKTLAIVLFFMHVFWSSRLTMIFAVSGALWLMIMFAFTFADFATRSPETALTEQIPAHADHGSQDSAGSTGHEEAGEDAASAH
jgi:cytochrome c oxidase subunit IV